MSPTQRTLSWLRARGLDPEVVEYWHHFAGVRKDLLGVFDILYMSPEEGIVGVQTTTLGHQQERVRKIQASSKARLWLASGGRIEVWGWRKLKAGWTPKILEIELADFPPL